MKLGIIEAREFSLCYLTFDIRISFLF